MKIAFIVYAFPKLSETFILNQITGLIDRGHDVEIFAQINPREKKIHSDVKKYGLMGKIRVFHTPKDKLQRLLKALFLLTLNFHKDPVKILKSLNFLCYRREALSLKLFYTCVFFLNNGFPKKDFDIIYCHFGPNGIVGTYLKDIGVSGRLVTVFHGSDMSKYLAENGDRVYRNLLSKGDLFLPVSNHWKKKLISLGCNEKKMRVHHMGISRKKFKFVGSERSHDKGVVFLTVGRLTEEKGYDISLKAFAKLKGESGKNLYLIVGEGSERDKLVKLTKQLRISDCVKFLGELTQDEVSGVYLRANIFLLPSIREGIPVSLMEAQSSGLPVITTACGGIPELVTDGESGFLVPIGNVDALAEKMEYLIDHPDIRIQMGLCGSEIVAQQFDIDKLNDKLVELLSQIL
ncbi:MAG: glycosyltransferase [Methanobacteriota archaeon]